MRNQSLFLKKMTALATALMFLVISSVNRVEATASIDLTPTQIKAAVEEYYASLASLDIQRYVNNFTSNGVVEAPVGTPPIEGTEAIAAHFGEVFLQFTEGRYEIQEVIVCKREAAVNWKLLLKTTNGDVITLDGMGVIKFNLLGKVQSVREFFN
ncbi:MAG TPA: nuclear transport factor 2 family protein [Blastocatellia bacterium]|nr:nuclear transport factor 2 family protein [Blastocatellia bacterium]